MDLRPTLMLLPCSLQRISDTQGTRFGATSKRLYMIVLQNVCRSEEHTSELQSHLNLVCRLLLEKKNRRRALSLRSGQTRLTLALSRHSVDPLRGALSPRVFTAVRARLHQTHLRATTLRPGPVM